MTNNETNPAPSLYSRIVTPSHVHADGPIINGYCFGCDAQMFECPDCGHDLCVTCQDWCEGCDASIWGI